MRELTERVYCFAVYANEHVTRLLATNVTSVWRRSLPFQLAQAGFTFHCGSLGLLALLLATFGPYAIIPYNVSDALVRSPSARQSVPPALGATLLQRARAPRIGAQRFGHAEIRHHGVTSADQHVFRLDVALENAVRVGKGQCIENLPLTVRLFREARLPIRVRLVRWATPTDAGLNAVEWDTVPERIAPRVIIDGRKWVIDGTPFEQLALQRSPYPGRAGWHGRLNFPLDTGRAMLATALRPGAPQPHLHVVGDSTAEFVLRALESLAPDSVWRARRVRFEHGAITGPQIARAARLGITIAQPRGSAPYHSWQAAGIRVAYGSDMQRNPYLQMMTPMTGGDRPDEAVSREKAVSIYTLGSAYAERAEREKGMLAPGMLADLAVLSQDIFTIPAQALPGTRSVLTVVGARSCMMRSHGPRRERRSAKGTARAVVRATGRHPLILSFPPRSPLAVLGRDLVHGCRPQRPDCIQPSVSVRRNATSADSSARVRPRLPSSSRLTFSGTSGLGQHVSPHCERFALAAQVGNTSRVL
jgi:hypothetical protein